MERVITAPQHMPSPGFERARAIGAATVISAIAAITAACGGNAPQPPVLTPPAGSETITGAEQIGWDQRAGDTVELAGIRYAVYVDGVRSELTGVRCAATASATGYACTAPLPRMNPGAHTLELASFVVDGSLLESSRSAALQVTVVAASNGENR
jgi:hypothetical protein